ncbi:MAG: hypothetical protein AAFR38_14460 [Planctomycetota bacterium]
MTPTATQPPQPIQLVTSDDPVTPSLGWEVTSWPGLILACAVLLSVAVALHQRALRRKQMPVERLAARDLGSIMGLPGDERRALDRLADQAGLTSSVPLLLSRSLLREAIRARQTAGGPDAARLARAARRLGALG